jgi:hypothetical protein
MLDVKHEPNKLKEIKQQTKYGLGLAAITSVKTTHLSNPSTHANKINEILVHQFRCKLFRAAVAQSLFLLTDVYRLLLLRLQSLSSTSWLSDFKTFLVMCLYTSSE